MSNNFFSGGRSRELDSLEKLYSQRGFAFAVVYGRRRVGKTSLVGEFIRRRNKKAIRFTATESTDATNLENFSQSVFAVYPELSVLKTFPTWESALEYVAKQSKGQKLILEIDEYPYLAKSNPAISSVFQKCIDNTLQNTNILLILCGSSMSFMENQVLGYQSPLYGRRTAQYRIMPLDYYDSAEFFGGATRCNLLLGYAVTGGIPQYLNVIARARNIENGIANAFFSKDGFLYEEPQNLLKQELREPALYNAIIAAIAGGATKLNEISGKVKDDGAKVAKYIKNLIDLGIVEKNSPIITASERGGIYNIKDGMYRFWYRFVPSVTTLIENGYEHVYEKRIKPHVSDFMGRAFEKICREYLIRLNVKERLPFLFDGIGGWWGGNPITKQETEIDIMAVSKNRIIAGECKWQNEKTKLRVYKDLRDKTAMFAEKDIYYYIFSKSGFSKDLTEEAKRDKRLTLVGIDDLFEIPN